MEDTQPQTTKPISDDQELAKVLAGVSTEANNLEFEETPMVAPAQPKEAEPNAMTMQTPPVPSPNVEATNTGGQDSDSLETIKKDALTELRPLVEKLDLEVEEKFDIYLLLIRSTDDRTLIAPAHAAARAIPDEAKRAQALLDIIKEIDFFSNPQQPSI